MKKYSQNNEQLAQTSSDPDVLRELLKDENYYVRYYMAENPNRLPYDILEALSNDKIEFIRGALVDRKDLPKDILLKLSKDSDTHVRSTVAARTKDIEILTNLTKDPDQFVRRMAFQNSNLPVEIMLEGLESQNEGIALALARNKGLPPELVEELYSSRGGENKLNELLAGNPNTPESILFQLIDSENLETVEIIAEREDLTPALYHTLLNTTTSILTILVNSIYTPKKVLERIITIAGNNSLEANRNVILAAAKRFRDYDLLSKVLDSASKRGIAFLRDVMLNMARNPGAPDEILFEIVDSFYERPKQSYDEKEIRDAVANNPNVSQATLDLILKSEKKQYRDKAKEVTKVDIDKAWDMPNKVSTDLELLLKLKGYLKNV